MSNVTNTDAQLPLCYKSMSLKTNDVHFLCRFPRTKEVNVNHREVLIFQNTNEFIPKTCESILNISLNVFVTNFIFTV